MNKAIFVLAALIFNATSFASEQVSEFHDQLIGVYGLRCEIRHNGTGREPSAHTFLRPNFSNTINDLLYNLPEGSLQLVHDVAWVEGCDHESINDLMDLAYMRYMHVSARAKVVGEITNHVVHRGQCKARYLETVTLDLGFGVVLQSQKAELRDHDGCK